MRICVSLLSICLLSTIIVFGQNSPLCLNSLESKNYTDTIFNSNYLRHVLDERSPEISKDLEKMVAIYPIKKSEVYDGIESYRITFSHEESQIIAVFDAKGRISRTFETYRQTPLPKKVMGILKENFPDWTVTDNFYSVSFRAPKYVDKHFKVRMFKDSRKKSIVVDMQGELVD